MKALKVKVSGTWLDSVDVNDISVQVIGREDEGMWNFANLAAAQKQFPELDPLSKHKQGYVSDARRGDAPALRFETWAACDVYSS